MNTTTILSTVLVAICATGSVHAQPLSPDDLARRNVERRAVEAICRTSQRRSDGDLTPSARRA